MHALQQAKQQVLTELKKAIGKTYTPSVEELSYPPDAKLGDLSFACFVLAKGLKRNPNEIASEIAAKIGPKGFLKSIVAVGPYVNFHLDDVVFADVVMTEITDGKDRYGMSDVGKGKRIMVEFAQPNTNKEIHVGHLRNFIVGQMVVDVLKVNGYDVIPTSYINDLGTHVATCLWALKKYHDGVVPEGEEVIAFLESCYSRGMQEAVDNLEVKKEISVIFQQLEALKGSSVSAWKRTRKLSLDYIKWVFKDLNLTIDVWYYESDLVKDAKREIENLVEKGIVKSSQGAWIVDLEKEKLGVNLLVKTDGTLLYNAKDIVLALRKEEDHHPMRSLYVIDARQSLAMQQLFATLKRMGFQKELQHVSYEFVTLKDGAMSSRKGNIVRYETFRDEMIEVAVDETRKRHEDWDEKKTLKTARAIAFAAIRFGMLKQDLDKQIVFDKQEAMSFDGFTGPYLLYSYARMQSILRKGKKVRRFVGSESLGQQMRLSVEHRLLTLLAKYPETVFQVGQTLHLSSLAQYLFELSKTFSEYYDQVPVLSAPPELIASRVQMVRSVAQVLKNGLTLLGIDPVDEM